MQTTPTTSILFYAVLLAVQIPFCHSSEEVTKCCQPGGVWSEWMGSKATCPDYCGGAGTYPRTRTCLSELDGCPCVGETLEQTPCDTSACNFPRNNTCYTGKSLKVVNSRFVCVNETGVTPVAPAPSTCADCCPIAGVWSEWVASGVCSATCGSCGTVKRTRTCLSDKFSCPCTGNTTEMKPCNSYPCNATTTCCTGFQSQFNPSNGVYECLPITPTLVPQPQFEICCDPAGLGLWNEWSSWSLCSATCGLCGMRSRVRTCASQMYGCPCVGLPSETEPCGGLQCPTGTPCCTPNVATKSWDGASICVQQTPATLVGTWSNWTSISGATCSDTCGGCGTISKRRTCLPAGSQCTGEFESKVPCGFDLCTIGRPTCCTGYTKSFDAVNRLLYCEPDSVAA